jgi:uncharacterized membrane protein
VLVPVIMPVIMAVLVLVIVIVMSFVSHFETPFLSFGSCCEHGQAGERTSVMAASGQATTQSPQA